MRLLILLSLAFALLGCGGEPNRQKSIVREVANEDQLINAMEARWEIEIWDGVSITGPPETNDIYIPEARKVLDEIVQKCALGETWLSDGTDGVMTLYLEDTSLSDEQIDCVRSYEQPGIILRDKKAP
ncbi:glycosyltransferase family 61 protein [Pseudoblastomonas halimionae]|uniref:Lipoprotein n=1 Tax=Alteriqipengyuania halimionae TaxID=1926630 RepID=A0A6I4TZV6_9SPHN|nr:hypothetical protein [Alteriqipengyuania halimionae]MXP09270.1 hypothetical protein [Alteriqipengyuania halimionae]